MLESINTFRSLLYEHLDRDAHVHCRTWLDHEHKCTADDAQEWAANKIAMAWLRHRRECDKAEWHSRLRAASPSLS